MVTFKKKIEFDLGTSLGIFNEGGCIGNEVAAWLIAIEDAGLFMYVKVLRQAG